MLKGIAASAGAAVAPLFYLEEPDLSVREVELVQEGETGRLTVYLDWQGEELVAQLPV